MKQPADEEEKRNMKPVGVFSPIVFIDCKVSDDDKKSPIALAISIHTSLGFLVASNGGVAAFMI